MPFFLTTDIFMICILSASQFASLQVKLWHKWIQCGLRGCYYLWWNPCLLSVTFFLKTTRKVFNKVAPLPLLCSFWFRWSSIVCNFCERGRRSRKGVGSGSRRLKGFNVPRGEGGSWPPARGRRLPSGFLRGIGLGALRAILTQINQTAAVGPGRPQGLRPPRCESEDSSQQEIVNLSEREFSRWECRAKLWESEIHFAALLRAWQGSRRSFQLSPPSLVFCLKTSAFGNICWKGREQAWK